MFCTLVICLSFCDSWFSCFNHSSAFKHASNTLLLCTSSSSMRVTKIFSFKCNDKLPRAQLPYIYSKILLGLDHNDHTLCVQECPHFVSLWTISMLLHAWKLLHIAPQRYVLYLDIAPAWLMLSVHFITSFISCFIEPQILAKNKNL